MFLFMTFLIGNPKNIDLGPLLCEESHGANNDSPKILHMAKI